MRLFRSLDPGFENPSERLLPKNRLRAYFDILRTRFGTLVLLSLLTFLFFIPYYFWRISWGAYMALPPAEELSEALMLERSFWLESFGALVEWPLLLVAALGLGGAFEIARMLSFQEGGIFLGKDFFRGLRENWKSALLAGGIWGFFSLLFRMYSRYAERQGWKIQILDVEEGAAGGYSRISFMVKGENVYSKLKFESGAHRVQRVPKTEAQGRIHTSTATVLVMPEAEEVDVEINPSDLKIDTYRSQGAGGQNVNKTESAVRITHIPTGLVVSCQTEKAQLQNKEICMRMIRAKVHDFYQSQQDEARATERKLKVGTGERSEKIRTYNYPQNRVTDHRIGFTINQLDRVMEGELDPVIEALVHFDQEQKILEAEAADADHR